MAAPVAAAGLGALAGRGLMSAGYKLLGSAGTRSAAGQMLKTGGIKGGAGGGMLNSMVMINLTKGVLDVLKRIEKSTEKISPMLSQQITIMQKAVQVFLRPIGDFIAKLLRPVAIWFLKIAVKWYQWLSGVLGTGGGENKTKSGKEDLIKQLESEKSAAVQRGDTQGAAGIQTQIDALTASIGESLWQSIGKFFTETIPDIASKAWDGIVTFFTTTLPNIFNAAFELFTTFWTVVVPSIFTEKLPEAFGFAIGVIVTFWTETFPKLLEDAWTMVINFFTKTLPEAIVSLVETAILFFGTTLPEAILTAAAAIITNMIIFFGTTLPEAITAACSAIKTFFTETIPDWFNTMVDKIKGFWDKIKGVGEKIVENVKKGYKEGKEFISEKAVGGQVRDTGLYKLHAGENVMTAADSSRAKGSQGSKSFNNYININANISSDMDIKSLARKLAEYQEVELRRRVSY
jgi:hypothetical protein